MKNRIKSFSNNLFIQGSFLFTVSNLIISLLNYFFNFLVGRALGPSGYGEITAFFSYTALFSIPFTIISTLIIQKIGSKETNHYAYAKSLELWFIKKIKKWWYLSLLLIILAPIMPRITNVSGVTGYLIIVVAILSPFSVFYSSALQGLKLFLISVVISIFTGFIKFTGALLVSLKIDGLLTVLLFLTISSIFNLVAVILSFRKYVKSIKAEAKIEKGIKYFSMGRIMWFTNLETTKRHEELTLYKKYTPKEYPEYDEYDAIEVSRVYEIPMDYNGAMGVPITFVDKYNPGQFKIIGIDRYVEDNPIYGKRFTINNNELYARILIKRKNENEN